MLKEIDLLEYDEQYLAYQSLAILPVTTIEKMWNDKFLVLHNLINFDGVPKLVLNKTQALFLKHKIELYLNLISADVKKEE